MSETIEIISDKPKRGRPKKPRPLDSVPYVRPLTKVSAVGSTAFGDVGGVDEQLIQVNLEATAPTAEGLELKGDWFKSSTDKPPTIEKQDKLAKKLKDDIFKAYINNPKETRSAILHVGEGSDIMNELNTYNIEKLELVQKSIMYECGKKIDDKMISAIVEQSTNVLDLLLQLDGHLKSSVSESTAIKELTKDTISNSFIVSRSPVVKLIGAYGSHVYSAWKASHKEVPKTKASVAPDSTPL